MTELKHRNQSHTCSGKQVVTEKDNIYFSFYLIEVVK